MLQNFLLDAVAVLDYVNNSEQFRLHSRYDSTLYSNTHGSANTKIPQSKSPYLVGGLNCRFWGQTCKNDPKTATFRTLHVAVLERNLRFDNDHKGKILRIPVRPPGADVAGVKEGRFADIVLWSRRVVLSFYSIDELEYWHGMGH